MSQAPYPGLRPFRRDEADIFFGRDDQVDQLLAKLGKSRFLGVIGPSGCGKSSLVQTGLLNSLDAGFLASAKLHWHIATLRPGTHPMGNLAQDLIDQAKLWRADTIPQDNAAFLSATLRRGPLGLIEALRENPLPKDTNLLIVVDQFEEIFRYRKHHDSDEAEAFVALLLRSVAELEMPIYVIITMRSDFLGDCALFAGLPEALNDSQFLTPRLTREQRREAIIGPARVFGGEVEPALVNRLLNDMGADPDQLPILQHALMRLWTLAELRGKPVVLTLKDYIAIGGLNEALSKHADEALRELTHQQQEIAETLFRALSERSGEKRDTRRLASLDEVAAVADGVTWKDAPAVVDRVTWEDVAAVVEAFRRPDRSFLTPPVGEVLTADKKIDISHESLIRQWRQLADWVTKEAESAEIYLRLRDWALRWDKGNAGPWRDPDLATALGWRERDRPNPYWAERYGSQDDFKVAMAFIDASEGKQHKDIAAEKEQRDLQLRRAQRMAWSFGLVAIALIACILAYYFAAVWEYDAYYNTFVKRWGVPEGIGRLTAEKVGHRALSYKITRKGRFGPVVRMQAVNAMGQPTTSSAVITSFVTSSSADVSTPSKETRWEYGYGDTGKLVYEVSLDRFGRRYQSVSYSPSDDTDTRRDAYLIGKSGSLSLKQGTCSAYVRYEYDRNGHEILTHYLDQAGNKTPGRDNAISLGKEYDSKGNEVSVLSLGRDGKPMNDRAGNAEVRYSYDDMGNYVEGTAFDAVGTPIKFKEGGYSRMTQKYDEFGNGIDLAYFDEFGKPVNHAKDGWQRAEYRYDQHGNVVEVAFWDANGERGKNTDGCHRNTTKFDMRGNPIQTGCFGSEGQAVLIPPSFTISKYAYDEQNRLIEETYFDAVHKPVNGPDGAFKVRLVYNAEGDIVETSFFGPDGKPTIGSSGYHKILSKFEAGHEVRTEYLGVDGNLVVRDGDYAAIQRTYDPHGNEVRFVYLGPDNKPVINRKQTYAIVESTFDPCGRVTETRYLDVDENGELVPLREGYARIKQAYHEDNNVKEVSYFDAGDEPVRASVGYARLTRAFDRHGNIIDERYFDEDHQPLLLEQGYAGITYSYDGHNAKTEVAYFGTNGKPILVDGAARIEYKNDKHGRNVGQAYFGVRGEPVIGVEDDWRFHRATSKLDSNGHILELDFFGTDGSALAIEMENGTQCAKFIFHYDGNDEVIDMECFDAAGNRMSQTPSSAEVPLSR